MIPYDDIRPDLRTGDVCMASGRGCLQRLIRVVTGETVNHIGLIVVEDAIKRPNIVYRVLLGFLPF